MEKIKKLIKLILVILLVFNSVSIKTMWGDLIFDTNFPEETGVFEIKVDKCDDPDKIDSLKICQITNPDLTSTKYQYSNCKRKFLDYNRLECTSKRVLIDSKNGTGQTVTNDTNSKNFPNKDDKNLGWKISDKKYCTLDNGVIKSCKIAKINPNTNNTQDYFFAGCGVFTNVIWCDVISDKVFTENEINQSIDLKKRYQLDSSDCTINNGTVQKCTKKGFEYNKCKLANNNKVDCEEVTKVDPNANNADIVEKKIPDTIGVGDKDLTRDSSTPNTGPGKITYKSFTSFPGIGQISSLCELTKALWFIGFGILFISVLGMYMYGGFLYTSAGVNASGVNRAKEIFTNSTIGLVLGLSIYVILNTLNPNLLNAQCTIGTVPNAPTGVGIGTTAPPGQSIVVSGKTSFPIACDYARPSGGQLFGASRDNGRRRHAGLDLAPTGGNKGCKVLAFQDGEVTGYVCSGLIIKHANGLTTRYLHNEKNFVQKGDIVTAGQEIGIAGDRDCRSQGVHLHFDLIKNGTYVDPTPVILDSNSQPKSDLLNSSGIQGQ